MMANDHNQHTPFVHLSVNVTRAAADMIELIGVLTTIRRYQAHLYSGAGTVDLEDLRKAVKRAADAVRNYDACLLAGIEKLTGKQFNDASEVL